MSILRYEVEIPAHDHKQITYWMDEQIWGHRVLDSQSPWLIFLEFLGVVESSNREGRLLDEKGKFYPLLFHPHQRMFLRNILYNNQIMPYVLDKFPDSNRAWREWQSWMKQNARGVIDSNFSYLSKRFSTFDEFSRLVQMLRSATVESDSNRRWSSRFIFPFGDKCLYEDVGITAQGKPVREYNNFGRSGELVYLMLCRSKSANLLKPFLSAMVTNSNPWNVLVSRLQDESHADTSTRGQSYLPYKSHPAFDLLGEDLLHLLQLELPGFDSYAHITLMISLHLMLYQLKTASQIVGGPEPALICEVVAPRKTLVRELSIHRYQQNSQLSTSAISVLIDSISNSEEWSQAKLATDAYPRCKDILIREFKWPRDPDDYDGAHDPDALIRTLKIRAMGRHRQSFGNVHRTYGRAVGLISKRGTNKLRYAPNDALLKALILANVKDRLEFKLFLERLYDRYGIVLGEREAKRTMADDDFDIKAFQSNAGRLEQRLSSLGMLKRLSDACAYVLNPYSEQSR
jgi:hypothetical protein